MDIQRFHDAYFYWDGGLYWRNPLRRNTKREEAGGLSETLSGYRRWCVRLANKSFSRARVVWMMHHGAIPADMQVDHINHDSTDDRIANLRLLTPLENIRHRRPYRLLYVVTPGLL